MMNKNLLIAISGVGLVIALIFGYLIGQNQSLKQQVKSEETVVEVSPTPTPTETESSADEELSASKTLEENLVSQLSAATVKDDELDQDLTDEENLVVESCLYYQYVQKGDSAKDNFGEAEECGKLEYELFYCTTTQDFEVSTFISRDEKQTEGRTLSPVLDNTWPDKTSDTADCDSSVWQQYNLEVEPPYYSYKINVKDKRSESLPVREFFVASDGCCGVDVYMLETRQKKQSDATSQVEETKSPSPKSTVTTNQKEGSGQKKLIQTMCSSYLTARNAWYQANRNTYTGGVGVEEGGQQALQQATERLASVIDPKAGNAYIDMKDFVFHLRQIYNAYYPTYDYWTLDGNRPKLIILRDKIEANHC